MRQQCHDDLVAVVTALVSCSLLLIALGPTPKQETLSCHSPVLQLSYALLDCIW